MSKPIVFSYKRYEELRDAYKALLEDNNRLMADNKRLRQENTNLQIRCRIAEEDRQTVAYICDGNSCGADCSKSGCTHTRSIEHAVNFTKIADGHYMEEER